MHELNSEQRAALDTKGDVLLVACPGSGKTRTLIQKIALELSKASSHRKFVVALTYTHVAAEEIRDRIDAMGIDTSQLWVGTIHSFCLTWILRPYSLYHESLRHGFGVVDIFESDEMLDEIASRHLPLKNHHDCKYYATRTGYEFDRSTSPDRIEPLKKTIAEYHEQLLSRSLIDFEMMLKFSHDLLVSHAPIARRLGALFQFIAIDEYQDTREIQYFIVGMIIRESMDRTGLFIVGDPNQAIFGSLGGVAKSAAEISLLTGRIIKPLALHQNYRSSQQIIDYFGHFAVEPMFIEASGEWKDWTSSIVHDVSISKTDLVKGVADLVRHNIETLRINPESIAVIAPWWIHLASITRALVQELPEYEFNGPGLSPFGQNLDNFWYKVARIALTFAAPDMFRKRMRWAQELVDELTASGYASDSLTARELLKITNEITSAGKNGTEFLINFFEEFCHRLGFEPQPGSELSEQRDSFFRRMENRISDIQKRENVDVDDLETFRKVFRPRRGVVVSTIHGVKGAEFDSVIAFGLLEGFVPHFNEPEAEKDHIAKKLLFVIGSRARKNLFLVSETGRGNQWHPKYQSNVLEAVHDHPYTSRSINLVTSSP
ncbi:ATP-dependent helicase [Salinibacterium amurskyense]|uniref:ATP-dependent helicase n=1 Tax=Salinibacterium amurskyense TaxID=205941 RepID=UPI00311E0CD6